MEEQIPQNQELIQISETEINGVLIKTVSARDLHSHLEVGKDFSTWIKNRIEKYDFIENQDFIIDSPNLGNQTEGRGGDRRSIEYHITLDMAKELSMVENNEQGRLARRYFIECEKKLREVVSVKAKYQLGIINANTETDRMVALSQYEIGYVKPLEKKVEEQAPKADYFDKLVDSNLLTNFRDTAKEFKVGQKFFISFLLDNKYIFRDKKNKLKPYQNHIDNGLFELKEFVRGEHTDVQTLITPKGRETFKLLLEVYQQ